MHDCIVLQKKEGALNQNISPVKENVSSLFLKSSGDLDTRDRGNICSWAMEGYEKDQCGSLNRPWRESYKKMK